MFLDRQLIRTTLFGLVGFEQTTDPEYPLINASLLESRSGRLVNQEHPLITIENIDQSIKNFSAYNYPDFNVGTEYSLGEKVAESSINYEYINASPSTGNTPPNATYWKVIDALSDYLTKSSYQGIDEAIDAIIDDKKIRKRVKSIYENVLLYDGLANYRDNVPNESNFVGLRLRLKKDRSLITVINKIGTQFSEIATGSLTLSLYHSSQESAIATFTVTPGNKNSSKWTALPTSNNDRVIRYLSDDYDAGGDFYLGYKQSDLASLGTEALKMDVKGLLECGCSAKTTGYFHNYSNYIDVVGFEIAETEMPLGVLFDPSKISITLNNNYGLNLNMNSQCDIGDFIIQEEALLSHVINLSTAHVLMRGIAYNDRGSNSTANLIREQAKKELFVHREAWGTLVDRYRSAVKAASFDLSGLNDDCLPSEDLTISIGSDEHNFY